VNETGIEDRTADPDHGNVKDPVTNPNIEQSRNLQQMNDPLLQVPICLSNMFIKINIFLHYKLKKLVY